MRAAREAAHPDYEGALSYELERALICERIGWQRLPHELDEMGLEELSHPLQLLRVFRVYQHYYRDLESMTEEELSVVDLVEGM